MKSCNDARNVSNDGKDDAYDTLPGHNHFLVLPWPGNGGADVGLRNSENWICTDTRQTSHKTLLLKVKVSRSAIFCFWPPLIPCCKLVQISREMKLCRAFWPQAGSVWRVTSPPLFPIAHMSLLVTMSHTSCVTWKTVRNLERNLIVNLYHCGIVFNCEWDLVLLHYAL